MRKRTRIFTLVMAMTSLFAFQSLNAQTFYKVHHINETFDNLGAALLPTNWSSNKSSGLYCRNAGYATDNASLKISGSGSGNRGIDLLFNSPIVSDTTSNTWYVEFDWTCNKVVLGPKNSLNMVFSGNTNNINVKAANFYVSSIFGIYLSTDGYFHYWNQDPHGPIQSDTAQVRLQPEYHGHMGPAFRPGGDGSFYRNGVSTTHSADSVLIWNTPTKTNVRFVVDSSAYNNALLKYGSKTYHITAKLNFTSQKVESLTISQKDDELNTQTILDMPFLAPYIIGNDTTIVARENRKALNLTTISLANTKTSGAGNGYNTDFLTYTDNLEIYYLKESVGTTNVTVYFKDKDGNTAKTERIESDKQLNELFHLLDADKESFTSNGFYYAYDVNATHEANAGKGEDGESVLVSQSSKDLTVIFKKFPIANSPLVWEGFEGPYWNEIDGNFKSGETLNLGFQKGLAVELSDALAPKDIVLSGVMDLGTNNLTISTEGYNLSSNGNVTDKLIGSGKVQVNAPATLSMINKLKGGLDINTTSPVFIKSINVGDTIHVVDNANIKLELDANCVNVIKAKNPGSTLNIEAANAVKDRNFSYKLYNVATTNMKLDVAARQESSSWQGASTATYPDSMLLNVYNGLNNDTLIGFGGVAKTNLQKVRLNLGDSIRLVRNYNEANGEICYFGSISGTPASIIEGGFVSGRAQTFKVGGLNNDAVFEGAFRPYLMSNKTFRMDNTLHLNKAGTGKWTLSGHVNHVGDITVEAGELILSGKVDTLVSAIVVDSLATLRTGSIEINSKNVYVKNEGKLYSNLTTFAGDLQVTGSMTGGAKMYNFGLVDGDLNLNMTSFEEGEHEAIVSQSDITIIRSTIHLYVGKARKGQTISVLNAGSGMISYPEGADSCKIFVNGVNITANTAETAGAQFVYFPETGELSCMEDYINAVEMPVYSKEIKTIEYFNVVGQPVDQYTKGLVIRKTTFMDNTVKVDKYHQKR